jgi:hypothetical protein
MAAAAQPASGVPPLPAGFTIDTPAPATSANGSATGGIPPLPAGFALDSSAPPADETAGRVAGLAGRALVKGVGDLVGMIPTAANAVNSVYDPVGTALENQAQQAQQPSGPYKPQLSDFVHPEKWQQAAEYFADRASDKAGLPTPATPAERIGSKAVEAIPSAVLAPEAPILAGASAAAGGAASQATAEAGGGPVAQTLAGLAAGSVPGATSALAQTGRALVRDQVATAGRIADAAAIDTPLTAGQATGSKLLQRVEGASSKVWGGAPLRATADTQTESLGDNVSRVVDNLAPGADVSPTGAGEAINAGGTAAKANMKAAEKSAYDKVDTLVPANSPVDVSGTLSKLDELATPPPGASNTAGALISPKIAAMRDNLKADIAANGGSPTLPYEAATKLRTAVGNSIDWGFSPSDPVTNGAMKLVHGALKGDIDTSASAISPEAGQAVTDARTLYAQNQERRDFLNGIIDKSGGPEAVYQAATNGTKQGATKIGGVMDELDPGQQNLVRATVIDRLGKALPGQQNAAGDAFNASTFLTNWNKLAPEAKDALFGASGTPKTLRAGLDSLADTMSTIRNSTLFKNPSGTAEAAGHGYGLLALMGEGGAALMGHPHALAGTVGAIAGNAVLSRALTNPRTVAWLAQSAKMPTYALPNAVNQLAKMGTANNDHAARDLAAYLRQNQ